MEESPMGALLAVAGLVAVAAITPGPNNLVVMRAAARTGLAGALPEMVGIVLGGLALLGVVVVGGGVVFEAAPASKAALTLGGCAYLAWLGAGLVARSLRRAAPDGDTDRTALPAGVAGLFGFQFLNPKSWVMVMTAVSASQGSGTVATFARLAVLFAVIPTVCLVLWSGLGSLLADALRRPGVRTWFDRAMGGLLCASAVLLFLEA